MKKILILFLITISVFAQNTRKVTTFLDTRDFFYRSYDGADEVLRGYVLGAAADTNANKVSYIDYDVRDYLYNVYDDSLEAFRFTTIGGGAGTVTSITAGNGMSFTTITATGAVTMGTPGTLTSATTNGLTATSHTHAITTGLANTNITRIDDAGVVLNDYAKFTANGLLGRSYAEVLSDLSGTATATFDFNVQDITGISNITVGDNALIGLGSGKASIEFDDLATDEVNILNANVGLGISTPLSPLHIYGGSSGGTPHANALLTLETGAPYLQFLGTGFQGIYFGDAADNDRGQFYYNHSTDQMRFVVGAGSNITTMDATGFGIKNSNPSEALDVLGNIELSGNVMMSDNANVGLSGGGVIEFDDQAIDEVNILNAFVGIGTSTPSSPLHIYDDNSETGIDVGALIEQNGTGDAKLQFNLFGAQRYSFGIDNSDGDKLKLSSGTVLGLNHIFAIDPATSFFGYGTQNPASTFHIYENTGSTGSNTGLTVEQDGVGDAKINLFLTSSQRCNLGLDNTDNFFKIDYSTILGTDPALIIAVSNNVGIGASVPVALLDVAGSEASKVTTVNSATYTILITDNRVIVDYTTTGAVTLTLPAASTAWNSTDNTGITFLVKDLDCNAGTNNITINRAGSDTIIDDAAAQTSTIINSDGGAIWIQAVSSTEWIVY